MQLADAARSQVHIDAGDLVGGPGIPLFEADPPSFFFSRAGYWACGDRYGPDDELGAEHAIVSDNEPRNLFGAGLVIRRADLLALFSLPDFPVLSDRSGDALSGGNDCEICFMLMIAGGKLVYSDKLRFTHIIPARRLTRAYFRGLVASGGPGREYWRRLADYHVVRRGDRGALRPRAILAAAKTLMAGTGDRSAVFRIALRLGLTSAMTETERTALKMAKHAEQLALAKPLSPRSVALATSMTADAEQSMTASINEASTRLDNVPA